MDRKKIDVLTFFALTSLEAWWAYSQHKPFAVGTVLIYGILIFKHWRRTQDD